MRSLPGAACRPRRWLMYNLFVSGSEDSWKGDRWVMDVSRCVNEYTENALSARFGQLDEAAVAELKRLPCIFAYETVSDIPPLFWDDPGCHQASAISSRRI